MYRFALALLFGLSLAALGNADDFLMIVGGFTLELGGSLNTVELKSLSPDSPLPECLRSPRGNFPTRLTDAVGISLGGRVIVCGGSDSNYLSTCWSYNAAEDRWSEDGSMGEVRYASAAALTSQNEWVISGGYAGGSARKSSVESTSDGRNFETFPSMPIALFLHCIVSLDGDEGDLFVTGGWTGSVMNDRTFIFKDGEWKEMERMLTAREVLMCGPVRSQPRGPVEKIVVSGGLTASRPPRNRLSKVEVYNVQEDSWEMAEDLPFGVLYNAAVIPHENTFLMIGGRKSSSNSDKVWKYHKNGEWEEMDHLQLGEGKHRLTAIAIPSSIFPSC